MIRSHHSCNSQKFNRTSKSFTSINKKLHLLFFQVQNFLERVKRGAGRSQSDQGEAGGGHRPEDKHLTTGERQKRSKAMKRVKTEKQEAVDEESSASDSSIDETTEECSSHTAAFTTGSVEEEGAEGAEQDEHPSLQTPGTCEGNRSFNSCNDIRACCCKQFSC